MHRDGCPIWSPFFQTNLLFNAKFKFLSISLNSDLYPGGSVLNDHYWFNLSRPYTLLSRGATIDLETVVQAYRKRLPPVEFLVAECARLSGSTHFRALPTGRKMLEYILSELFRKNNLPSA